MRCSRPLLLHQRNQTKPNQSANFIFNLRDEPNIWKEGQSLREIIKLVADFRYKSYNRPLSKFHNYSFKVYLFI